MEVVFSCINTFQGLGPEQFLQPACLLSWHRLISCHSDSKCVEVEVVYEIQFKSWHAQAFHAHMRSFVKELQAGGPSSKADAQDSKQPLEDDAAAMKKKGGFPCCYTLRWCPQP